MNARFGLGQWATAAAKRMLPAMLLGILIASTPRLRAEEEDFLRGGDWLTAEAARKQNERQQRIQKAFEESKKAQEKLREQIQPVRDLQRAINDAREKSAKKLHDAVRANDELAIDAALRAAQADAIRRAAEEALRRQPDSEAARKVAEGARQAQIDSLNVAAGAELRGAPLKRALQPQDPSDRPPLSFQEVHAKLSGLKLSPPGLLDHADRILKAHEKMLAGPIEVDTAPVPGLTPEQFLAALQNQTHAAQKQIRDLYEQRGRSTSSGSWRSSGLASVDNYGGDYSKGSAWARRLADQAKERRAEMIRKRFAWRPGESEKSYRQRLSQGRGDLTSSEHLRLLLASLKRSSAASASKKRSSAPSTTRRSNSPPAFATNGGPKLSVHYVKNTSGYKYVGSTSVISAYFRNNTNRRMLSSARMALVSGNAKISPSGNQRFWLQPGQRSRVYTWRITSRAGRTIQYRIEMEVVGIDDGRGNLIAAPPLKKIQPTGKRVTSSTRLRNGQRLLIYSKGKWYRGHVMAVYRSGRVKVHYTGWDSKWDETLPRSRLQLP